MAEFIFMLTHHDSTVAGALEVYEEVRDTGLAWVGFKDVGQPPEVLRALTERMHADGRGVVLEVVSVDAESERRSIEVGRSLGVEVLMGGTRAHIAVPILRGSSIRYFPFPGRIVGHPSVLEGTVDEIAESAAVLTGTEGVAGLDLLAYRWSGDTPTLIRAVVAASRGPVVAAGSIETPEQIRTVSALGCWGFTIGGAVFERRLPAGDSIREQVEYTLDVARSAAPGGDDAAGA